MKICELLARQIPLADVHSFIVEIRRLLGTNKFPYPEFIVTPGIFTPLNALGSCSNIFGVKQVKITLCRQIMYDEKTAKRVIAHELCHEAVFQLIWNPKYMDLRLQAEDPMNERTARKAMADLQKTADETGYSAHGSDWLLFAGKVNAIYGTGYITQYSGDDYEVKPTKNAFWGPARKRRQAAYLFNGMTQI